MNKTMKVSLKVGLIFLMIYFAFVGCGAKEGQSDDEGTKSQDSIGKHAPEVANEAPLIESSEINCPQGTSLSYSNFGQGFMLSYCTSCHHSNLQEQGTSAAFSLDSERSVIALRTKIIEVLINQQTMPLGQTVPDEKLELASEWLKCGAP